MTRCSHSRIENNNQIINNKELTGHEIRTIKRHENTSSEL